MIQYFEGERYICLIMENGGRSRLYDFVKSQKNSRVDEKVAKPILRQVMSALSYCHSINVYHKDIKLENILINAEGKVKVIDFGFSIRMKDKKKTNKYCGSPAYSAPEIILNKPHLPEYADIWAVAVLIYHIIAGFLPF